MNNIFENAKFGDRFKTRDGSMAIYCGKMPSTSLHRLVLRGQLDSNNYNEFGEFKPHGNSPHDIVGKWEEPIDERVIDRLAKEYIKNEKYPLVRISKYNGFRTGFRVGYRIAKEL